MDKHVFETKPEALADLKANYHNLGHPIAFSGISKIQKYYNNVLSATDVENFLASLNSSQNEGKAKKPRGSFNELWFY